MSGTMGQADCEIIEDHQAVSLLLKKTDEEIATFLGCSLADVIGLRARRATEPFPPALAGRPPIMDASRPTRRDSGSPIAGVDGSLAAKTAII